MAQSTPPYEIRAKLAKINVLLLDNDEKMLALLQNVLSTLGFKSLFPAKDGFEGIHLLCEHKIDLVITDWDLQPVTQHAEIPENAVIITPWGKFPPNNGASFVRSLRHAPASPNPFVPVIMITGATLLNNIRYARDCGVNEIVMKPITAKELCERIIHIIEKPRPFVTSADYRGPCRRRKATPLAGMPERRKHDIQIIPYEERKSA